MPKDFKPITKLGYDALISASIYFVIVATLAFASSFLGQIFVPLGIWLLVNSVSHFIRIVKDVDDDNAGIINKDTRLLPYLVFLIKNFLLGVTSLAIGCNLSLAVAPAMTLFQILGAINGLFALINLSFYIGSEKAAINNQKKFVIFAAITSLSFILGVCAAMLGPQHVILNGTAFVIQLLASYLITKQYIWQLCPDNVASDEREQQSKPTPIYSKLSILALALSFMATVTTGLGLMPIISNALVSVVPASLATVLLVTGITVLQLAIRFSEHYITIDGLWGWEDKGGDTEMIRLTTISPTTSKHMHSSSISNASSSENPLVETPVGDQIPSTSNDISVGAH